MSIQGETLLEVKNMFKSFGPTIALKDVNLTIKRGQIHGLVGENGSGKSTVTSIASGLQDCDSGK
jgi:ribose transport system ATP-binding protein